MGDPWITDYLALDERDPEAKTKDYKAIDINKMSIPTLNALARILQFSDHTNEKLHID